MTNAPSRTELSALGEFGLIERLASRIVPIQPSTVKGIGDDAAIIDPQGLHQVITTDMLVEGVHFDLAYMPLKHLGYKAVVVNLSDVYAMNAEPRQIIVAVALSNRFPVEAVDELYEALVQPPPLKALAKSSIVLEERKSPAPPPSPTKSSGKLLTTWLSNRELKVPNCVLPA